MAIPYNLTYLFSSDESRGAIPIGSDGSRFTVDFDSPLTIGDPDGRGRRPTAVTCCVTQALIWSVTPNISPGVGFRNGDFPFVTGGIPRTIAIPEGLYSLSALDSYLSQQFVNLGLSANLMRLGGSDPTQTSYIVFENLGDAVDFRPVSAGGSSDATVAAVLGFDLVQYTAPSAAYTQASPNKAAFNRVNQYLITTTALNGLVLNKNSTGTLVSVPITAAPGSQIVYTPAVPLVIPCPELAIGSRTRWEFSLTDQAGRPTPTLGEFWSFSLSIRYYLAP